MGGIRRVFVWSNGERGEGWIPEGMEGFDGSLGYGVAHDVLEHFNKDTSIEAEMEAFGSILFIRHEGNWWKRRGSRYTTFAENLTDDFKEALAKNGYCVDAAPKQRRLDEKLEFQLADLVARAVDLDEWEVSGVDPIQEHECFVAACEWIRKGYYRARKRWNRWGPHNALCLFDDLADAVDKESKKHKEDGDKLIVSISLSTLSYGLRRKNVFPYYDY